MKNNNKLNDYIDFLFRNAPATKETMELREEILSNVYEKYEDLISSGENEEAAFNKTIISIGDIDSLIAELKTESKAPNYTIHQDEKQSKREKTKSAILISLSVALYILCPLPAIIFDEYYNNEPLGSSLLFVMVAIATGMLIYNSMVYSNKNKSKNVVEDFKDYRTLNSKKGKAVKEINSIIFLIATILYFVLNYYTGAWAITWLIFIIAWVVNKIIRIIML